MIIQDPEFGSLQFDGYDWILERRVSFNAVEIAVKVELETADSRALSSVQRDALRSVFSLPPDVLEQSAPAIVQNYEVYRDALGDEELPPLEAPVDVWQQVTPSYITVPSHGDFTIPTFLLMAECDWDPEHGLAVCFRNGIADESNQQGELGVED